MQPQRTAFALLAIKADVSDEEQVISMFQQAIQEFGTIDILVANAGLQRDSAFHQMTLTQWKTVIDINLTGQFLCAREALKEFLPLPASGRPSSLPKGRPPGGYSSQVRRGTHCVREHCAGAREIFFRLIFERTVADHLGDLLEGGAAVPVKRRQWVCVSIDRSGVIPTGPR